VKIGSQNFIVKLLKYLKPFYVFPEVHLLVVKIFFVPPQKIRSLVLVQRLFSPLGSVNLFINALKMQFMHKFDPNTPSMMMLAWHLYMYFIKKVSYKLKSCVTMTMKIK